MSLSHQGQGLVWETTGLGRGVEDFEARIWFLVLNLESPQGSETILGDDYMNSSTDISLG